MALIKRSCVLFVLIMILAGCSLQNNYESMKNGQLISGGRDTFYYKVNSKLALSDDTGASTDYIKWIPNKMNTADDAVNYGTECYSAVFDKVYCTEDFVVIKLLKYEQYIVIDCTKPQSECITSYETPGDIDFDFMDYPVIDCIYPDELR